VVNHAYGRFDQWFNHTGGSTGRLVENVLFVYHSSCCCNSRYKLEFDMALLYKQR
jgi:hypothetical protein